MRQRLNERRQARVRRTTVGRPGPDQRRRRARDFVLVAALLLTPVISTGSGAADVALRGGAVLQGTGDEALIERQTREVATQLRCPVCQGLSLQDSPTELAREMKAVVREQLASGKSPQEVKAYFISKYGEWILLEPTPTGFNLAVYLLPLLALLGGGVVVAVAVRRWTRQGAAVEAHHEVESPETPALDR